MCSVGGVWGELVCTAMSSDWRLPSTWLWVGVFWRRSTRPSPNVNTSHSIYLEVQPLSYKEVEASGTTEQTWRPASRRRRKYDQRKGASKDPIEPTWKRKLLQAASILRHGRWRLQSQLLIEIENSLCMVRDRHGDDRGANCRLSCSRNGRLPDFLEKLE